MFDGPDLEDLIADIEPEFEYVREVRPDASRDSSSELYLVAKHRLTGPVREGDIVEATIEDIGEEGDGIARSRTALCSSAASRTAKRSRSESMT